MPTLTSQSSYNFPPTSTWLNEKEVSELTGLSCSTLQKYRHHGTGIAYSKIGKAVRYSLAAVNEFMAAHQIDPRH